MDVSDEGKVLSVGTVGYKGDAALDVGNLADSGSVGVHFMELSTAHEADMLSVGMPYGGACRGAGGELRTFTVIDRIAIDRLAPDVGGAAVGFHVHLCNGEECGFAVGRNDGRSNALNLQQVVGGKSLDGWIFLLVWSGGCCEGCRVGYIGGRAVCSPGQFSKGCSGGRSGHCC